MRDKGDDDIAYRKILEHFMDESMRVIGKSLLIVAMIIQKKLISGLSIITTVYYMKFFNEEKNHEI